LSNAPELCILIGLCGNVNWDCTAPPSKNEQLITVEFELDWVDDARFSIAVNAGITVAKLKEEISMEEDIQVAQLKVLSEGVHQDDDNDDGVIMPVLIELQDDRPISEYSLEGKTITAYSMTYQFLVFALFSMKTR
jgi:hypothetical protein